MPLAATYGWRAYTGDLRQMPFISPSTSALLVKVADKIMKALCICLMWGAFSQAAVARASDPPEGEAIARADARCEREEFD